MSSLSPSVRIALACAALLLGLVATVALWRVGSGLQEQACVAKVQARYPAVPVSAFNTRTTGALKVSFVAERQRALGDC